jgi:hypothetical protein
MQRAICFQKLTSMELAFTSHSTAAREFVSYCSREVGGNRAGGRGGFGGDPKANSETLKAAGINSHYSISPDTAHEWQSWQRSLHQFAPLLFAN